MRLGISRVRAPGGVVGVIGVIGAIVGVLLVTLPAGASEPASPGAAPGPVSHGDAGGPGAPAPPAATPPEQGSVVPPRLASEAAVPYPTGAKGDGVVVLALTVNADGTVRAVRVLEGEEPFVGAALSAAPAWRFEPATRDGRAVAALIRFEIVFHAPVRGTSPAEATEAAAAARGEAPTPVAVPPGERRVSAATEVVVTGERMAPMEQSLTRAEVRQLPGAFGDPFRAIEILPGVTPVVSGLPFFYVRGAPPGNVGYFFDGVRVPYLYHVGLGPSVIHPAMVDRVDLYPGGYPARFGRYAGGIVTGEATAPRDDLHGEGNIRLLDLGALAETGFAGGKGTVLVGGRYSYTAAILSLVAKDIALDYRDFQSRVSYAVTPKDRVTLFGFGSYDLLGQKQNGQLDILFGSEFYRSDLRYDHSFGKNSTLRVATTLGYDQTRIAEQQNATDRMVGARLEINHPVSERVIVRGGADVTVDAFGTSPQPYSDPDDPTTKRFNALFPARDDLAVGAWSDVVLEVAPRMQVTPGVRVDVWNSQGTTARSVDPRISARIGVTDHVRFIHAYGLAHQAPSFIVPVPGLSPASLASGLQSSLQTSAGVEADLPDGMTASATLFHNAFYDMTDTLGAATGVPGGVGRSIFLPQRSEGQGMGLELYLHRRLTKRIGGIFTYTLSRSTRTVGTATFPSAFDRTHVVNGVVTYDLGRSWRAGTRVVFYTGVPKTVPSRGLILPPPPGNPDRDPGFFRVDLRLEKRWTVGKKGWLSFVLELLNATLSKETVASRAIGPVTIPSIGLEGGF
jgi:TonB family protein